MAEKKRPRRTRERILETSLELFNRHGAPRVTTANIADEMEISPGNLYYHFDHKEEIVFELYTQFEAGVPPLYADRDRHPDVDDLWLWLHLLFGMDVEVPFLSRSRPAPSQDEKLGARFGALSGRARRP
jgi:AcrR family transcriptional regulator